MAFGGCPSWNSKYKLTDPLPARFSNADAGTFDIESGDENGKRVEIDPLAFSQGFDSRPLEFKARFIVRSPSRRVVVEKTYGESEKNIDIILDKIHASKNKQ
ncbi:hypothetical protein F5884DRAFT_751862 [Xylogone sp. PMI_703]|nr:hypothetical protein F5884DRAFT_751862 [Xylogone sp. PMI_703]